VKKAPDGVDTTTPNAARMYDYYLGGKDHFEADRVAAEKILELMPQVRQSALENRRFLRRVVRFLAAEGGIAQFIDIGAGLPTMDPVHQVALDINPDAKVCYVDYDPVVVVHADALLTVPDRSIVVRADLRRPLEIMTDPAVNDFLDLSKPVAVLLLAVLHFISDADEPRRIMAELRDAIAPGSYLALTHVSGDFLDREATRVAESVYEKASAGIHSRNRSEILRFFDGFELVPPGLVPKHEWRSDNGGPGYRTGNISWGGVARKPA
jgi:S-adenosyl methyltransferase